MSFTVKRGGVASRWDFIQDAIPGSQSEDGPTWLRTSDGTSFYYDLTLDLWVALGNPFLYGVSSQLGGPTVGVPVFDNGHFHDVVENTTGSSWRPPNQLLLIHARGNANAIPTVNEIFEIQENGSVVWSNAWDGIVKPWEVKDIMQSFGKGNRLSQRVNLSAGAPASMAWRVETYWKFCNTPT